MLSTACPNPAKRERGKRKPVRRRNRKRYSANWTRAYGSPERVEFVNARPCVGCLTDERLRENHHIKTGGKGRKADARFIIPLCHECHEELHFMGARTFSITVGINLEKAAAVTEAAWLSYQSGAVSVIQGDQ